MQDLTEKAKVLLSSAGWTPERRVDLSQVQSDLKRWGYHLNPYAEQFLQQFVNLDLGKATFLFIDEKHGFAYESDGVSLMEEMLGKTACPVGFIDISEFPDVGMLIAEDGTVHWMTEGWWGFFAQNYIDALNQICEDDIVYTPDPRIPVEF